MAAIALSASVYTLLNASSQATIRTAVGIDTPATAAQTRAATSAVITAPMTPSNLQDYVTVQALTYASPIAWNMALGVNASVTLTGNTTLGAPTNMREGSSGILTITQDGTGSRTLAYNAVWKFAGGTAPTLSTTASAKDTIAWYSPDGTNFYAQLTKNWS